MARRYYTYPAFDQRRSAFEDFAADMHVPSEGEGGFGVPAVDVLSQLAPESADDVAFAASGESLRSFEGAAGAAGRGRRCRAAAASKQPSPAKEAAFSAQGAHPSTEEAPKKRRFHLSALNCLYESRDRLLCVFEDGRGHLTAVRTSRLA